MTAHDDWLAATPVKSTIPVTLFPLLAYVCITGGLLAGGIFAVQGQGTSLLKQLQMSLISSLCLGFGAIFTTLYVGVYV